MKGFDILAKIILIQAFRKLARRSLHDVFILNNSPDKLLVVKTYYRSNLAECVS